MGENGHKQAVLYARFSPRPNAEECNSIERQIEQTRQYCKSRDLPIVGEFEDRAISGKSMNNRPGLLAAIEAACKVKGVLVAYNLKRLARSLQDAVNISEMLKKRGADLCITDMNCDTYTRAGRMVYHIVAAVAEYDRESIAEETSRAMRYSQEQGGKISSQTPYGYCVDPVNPKRIIEDAGEQRAVEYILTRHKAGPSLRQICRELIEAGYPARGGQWRHGAIQRIIERSNSVRKASGFAQDGQTSQSLAIDSPQTPGACSRGEFGR